MLFLNNNQMKEIETNAFDSLQNLQNLTLDFNSLKRIDENFFLNLKIFYIYH